MTKHCTYCGGRTTPNDPHTCTVQTLKEQLDICGGLLLHVVPNLLTFADGMHTLLTGAAPPWKKLDPRVYKNLMEGIELWRVTRPKIIRNLKE